jgi:hypothetical protein
MLKFKRMQGRWFLRAICGQGSKAYDRVDQAATREAVAAKGLAAGMNRHTDRGAASIETDQGNTARLAHYYKDVEETIITGVLEDEDSDGESDDDIDIDMPGLKVDYDSSSDWCGILNWNTFNIYRNIL